MHLCKSDKKYNFLPIHKNHHSPIRPLNGVHLQPVCPRSGRGVRLGARPALRPPPGDADSAVLTAPGERRVLYLVDDGHGSTQSPLLPPCPAHALSATLPLSGWRQLAACPGHVCTCVSTQLLGARSSALPPLQGPAPAVAGDSHSASQAPFGEGTDQPHPGLCPELSPASFAQPRKGPACRPATPVGEPVSAALPWVTGTRRLCAVPQRGAG